MCVAATVSLFEGLSALAKKAIPAAEAAESHALGFAEILQQRTQGSNSLDRAVTASNIGNAADVPNTALAGVPNGTMRPSGPVTESHLLAQAGLTTSNRLASAVAPDRPIERYSVEKTFAHRFSSDGVMTTDISISADIPIDGRAVDPLAVSFIDGTLFGHATALSKITFTAADQGAPNSPASGLPNSASASSGVAFPKAGLTQSHTMQVALPVPASEKAFAHAPSAKAAIVTNISEAGVSESAIVPVEVNGSVSETNAAIAATGEIVVAEPLVLPPSLEMGQAQSAAPIAERRGILADQSDAAARVRPAIGQDDRANSIACFSLTYVAATAASDGQGVQLLVRAGGLNALELDQLENSLTSATEQTGGTVSNLRLNGIDRVLSVRS